MGVPFGPGGSIVDTNQGGAGGPRAGYLWGQQQASAAPAATVLTAKPLAAVTAPGASAIATPDPTSKAALSTLATSPTSNAKTLLGS